MPKKALFLQLIFSLVLSIILTAIWFSGGKMIAAGESGLLFYNASSAKTYTDTTWSKGALGSPGIFAITYAPLFNFISFFEQFIPAFVIQQFVFTLVLTLAQVGAFLFIDHIIAKKRPSSYIPYTIASIWYILNVFVLINVWNRLQYPYIFFHGTFPIVLYVYLVGLQQRHHRWYFPILWTLVSVIMTFTYASLPLIQLLWGVMGAYTFFSSLALVRKDRPQAIYQLIYFFSCMLLWILINSWWIAPFLQVMRTTAFITTDAYTSAGNLQAFYSTSERLGNLANVVRLMHKEFTDNMALIWQYWYQNPLIIIATFIPPLLVFLTLRMRNKSLYLHVTLGLVLISLFWMKGSNEPFGVIVSSLYQRFSMLESFRNPFEKIGLIIPILYAPLIAFSLLKFQSKINSSNLKMLLTALTIFVFLLPVWPMLNNTLFMSTIPPANNPRVASYVEVPAYYQQANKMLESAAKDSRSLTLPIGGEGITHTWEYGYQGVESYNGIFTTPTISLSTKIPYLESLTQDIEQLLFRDADSFISTLKFLNVHHIIVRKDIDYKFRKMTNPEEIISALSLVPQIEMQQSFGQLTIYKVRPEYTLPKIHVVDDLVKTSLHANLLEEIIPHSTINNSAIITHDELMLTEGFTPQVRQSIFPANKIRSTTLTVKPENALLELPSVRILPTDSQYPLIRIKEQIELFFTDESQKKYAQLNLTAKRLVELTQMINKNAPAQAIQKQIQRYASQINSIDKQYIFEDTLAQESILRQWYVLESISKQPTERQAELLALSDTLHQILITTETLPYYPALPNIFRIEVPEEGNYTIHITTDNWHQWYEVPPEITIAIDGVSEQVKLTSDQKFIELSNRELKVGIHEISIQTLNPINLISAPSQIDLQSTKSAAIHKFAIQPYDSFSRYYISFDYRLKKGYLPEVSFLQDLDIKEDETTPLFKLPLNERERFFDLSNFQKVITPSAGSRSAYISFEVEPWNNCLSAVYPLIRFNCKNKTYAETFNQPSSIMVQNLQVHRIFQPVIVLTKSNSVQSTSTLPEVTFTKQSDAHFRASIKGATQPFILVFSESFHPLWQASINNQTINSKYHTRINGYANAWYISNSGDYSVDLSFTAQDTHLFWRSVSGIVIGILVSVVISSYSLYLIKKR